MKQRVKLIVIVVLLAVSSAALAMSLGLFKVEAASAGTCNVPSGTYPAIQSAVNDISCDTINLTAAAYVENVTITRTATVQGKGADSTTVDGNASGSVFTIQSGLAVTITHVTIMNGNALRGGGVHNNGSSLTLDAVAVVSNTATAPIYREGGGGGIYNHSGEVRISNSVISGNSASSGGGILNNGVISITDSTFSRNSASNYGGGVYNVDKLNVANSTFSRNSTNIGGGIYNRKGSTIAFANTTFSNNSVVGNGGGIFNMGAISITNSTFSGNSAGGRGGGINTLDPGTTNISNATFSGNSSANGGGIFNRHVTSIANTIIAKGPVGSDCNGSITSLGYNIGSDNSCNLTATGDKPNTNPLLGPLQDNGGDSFTHAMLLGSPAIDAGNPAVPGSGSGTCTATDQRGVARPQGAACDVGSFETTLIIGKSGPTAAATASTITYTLEIVNITSVNLSNVVITDSIPVGAKYLGGGTQAGNIVSWIVPSLAPGVTVTRSFAVAATSTITNSRFRVSSDEGYSAKGQIPIVTFMENKVILPLTFNNFCPGYFDDFSNPASGWGMLDSDFVLAEYLNGEYRILSRQSGFFNLFNSPSCDRQNYVVEADARWVGSPGTSYGLIFGIADGFSNFYLFDINTDFREFRLLRFGPGGLATIVPITSSPAILAGNASNHLRVSRNGAQITLGINGTVLGTWSDGNITGLTGAGLVSSHYNDNPTTDARFDNFSMSALPGSAAVQHGLGPVRDTSQTDLTIEDHISVPIGTN